MIDNGDRGAHPTIVCPRCAWSGPPQESRLATCPTCGISFDSTHVPEPSTRLARRPPPGIPGTFRAPSMGIHAAPFPITGPGTCELGDDYLTVSGLRTRGSLLRFAVVMTGLALGIALAVLLSHLGLPDKLVAGCGFSVFLVGALTPLPPSKLAVRFRIPYDKVHSAKLLDNVVLIQIRDFAPTGEIHFATRDPGALVRVLTARR